MKKQVKVIIAVVVVLAIAIAVASYFFPRPMGDETSGTIGKADKFRKDQMAAKDILLRDDILKDTAAVAKTLGQLIEFSLYTLETKKVIDNEWIAPLEKNCHESECQEILTTLKEYSDFISNNIPLMKTTNDILVESYNNAGKEMSMDVGFQLLNFVNFIDQFLKRDSVFDQAITRLNLYISSVKPVDKARKAQVATLKKIRDRMVIDNLLFAVNTGDKKKYEFCSAQTLSDIGQLSYVENAQPIGSVTVASTPVINSILNTGNLGNVDLGFIVPVSNAVVASSGASVVGSQAVRNVTVLNTDIVGNIGNLGVSYANQPIGVIICSADKFGSVSSNNILNILVIGSSNNTVINSANAVYASEVFGSVSD